MPREVATLVMFPGQGAIEPRAGTHWIDTPEWSVAKEISELSGIDVPYLLLQADREELVRTDNAQIATFALSLMSYQSYLQRHPEPSYFVGHSLGEFSALVAAGVLSLEDGVSVVVARGRAMASAALLEAGAMAALMGGVDGDVSQALSIEGVWLGNVNGPDQIVVSGRSTALEYLANHVSEYGWKKCRLLQVGGAFHSPLMAPATDALRAALAQVEFRQTENTIFANVDGQPYQGGDVWRLLAERQLTGPVQFVSCIESAARSVTHAHEMQPAGVLKGLVKRIAPTIVLTDNDEGMR